MTVSSPPAVDTAHGLLRLPVYFPDATRAVVRGVDGRDLLACAVPGVVVNTFHLSARPGIGLIKAAGGVHRFMHWDRPVASDSGGFQLMSMIRENPRYGAISNHGIHFVDLDGGRERTLFTPERSIRLQFDLGADLMICLDDCPRPDATREEVEIAVERTIGWAGRCRAEFDRRLASRGSKSAGPRPLLLGVIQGGYDPDLRRRCAEGLRAIGFDGYGFGGWPLTPGGELAADILALTAELAPDAPRFALGTGSPEHIVACYRLGWRLFDCVLPTRDARHQRLYAWTAGRLDQVDLRDPGFYHFIYAGDKKHTRAKGPISPACDCPACQDYSLAYLHHLFDIGDGLAPRLATLHNLRFYTQLLELLRQA